jgi:hypothetical protein
LREAHPTVPDLGVLQSRHRDGGDRDLLRAEIQPGQADPSAARVSEVDDLAVFDLEPGLQLVRFSEEIGAVHRLDVVDAIGRRRVVVGDAEGERELWQTFDRLRGNPGDRGD